MKSKKKYLIAFTIMIMFLSFFVTIYDSHSAPEAFLCKSMGSNMGREELKKSDLEDMVNASSPNRKWTAQELFKKASGFTVYYGEGEKEFPFTEKVDRGLSRAEESNWNWNDSGVQENLESARINCTARGGANIISSLFFALANAFVSITNYIVTSLIGDDFMAESLVKIIGGDEDNGGGLIDIFFNSIYMPLVIIAFILTTVTIVYKGLIQMKFREALSSIIWSVSALVIGLTLMFNPLFMVKIPQAVTTTVTSCVIGALNGENCLTNEVTTPSFLVGKECRSEIIGGENDVKMAVNGMNCTIWKTFILQPWAEEQFGQPYSDLYTHNIPEGGNQWSALPEGEGEKYCVNLASTSSAEETGDNIVMDLDSDSTVCNVALYQLYLQTNIEDPINHPDDGYSLTSPGNGGKRYDARWYDIIVPMAKEGTHWERWSGENSPFGKIGTSFMSLFSVIMAGSVLGLLGVFGAAYKITSIIMLAFAPLFFLFAIEPTRGKKIFLGWLETLVSALLKYFATTLLVVVSLILYAGVLSNTSGITSFIAVIILTFALWMYRKEITDLIGASNMGGQKLSNKANEAIKGTRDFAGKKTSALVGGAIGGSMGAAKNRRNAKRERNDTIKTLRKQFENPETTEEEKKVIKERIKNEVQERDEEAGLGVMTRLKGATSGSKESLGRSMRRGTSLTSAAFRQKDMTRRQLEKERLDEKGELMKKPPEETNDSHSEPNDKPQVNSEDNKLEELKDYREKVEYDKNLSQEEKKALDEFSDSISNLDNDDDLINLENDPDAMKDPHKKDLVTNEINARLKYNNMNGKANGKLSRTKLGNKQFVSTEELQVNLDVARENYFETGNAEELNFAREIDKELNDRGIDKNSSELEIAEKIRDKYEETGQKHKRNESIPTNEELKKDPEKYLDKITISPALEKEKEKAESNKKDNEPRSNKKDSAPGSNKKDNAPEPDKKDNEPKPNKKDNAPGPNKKDNAPEPDKKDNEPRPNKKDNAPGPDKKDNEPNKKDNAPGPNKKDNAPGPNKKDNGPNKKDNGSNKKDNEPRSDKKDNASNEKDNASRFNKKGNEHEKTKEEEIDISDLGDFNVNLPDLDEERESKKENVNLPPID